MRVKLFSGGDVEQLEQEVNQFLNSLSVKGATVEFTDSSIGDDAECLIAIWYSVQSGDEEPMPVA